MPVDEFGFRYFARQSPDAVAVVDPDGCQWSRGRLLALADRVARGLVEAGLREGDAVAIVCRNRAEYLAIYLAAVDAGLYVVPINWHLSLNEIAFVIENSGARLLIADAHLSSAVLGALSDVAEMCNVPAVAIGDAEGWRSLDDFAAAGSSRCVPTSGNGRVLAYTSATTGRPKGVQLPLHNAAAALRKIVRWHQSLGIALASDNVHLCGSMLYHSAPLEGSIVALHMGHRVVLMDHWRPEGCLELIERHRVTTTFMVPTMFVRLLKLPEEVRLRYSTRSLRFVVHAGAPCPIPVKRAMLEWWGAIIWESYGAAEGQGAIASPQDWLKYPGTVGRPFEGSRFRILTESGDDATPGQIGSMYFTSHTGDRFVYKGQPEATLACYRGDFFTVGDVGYMNEDGYLFVCDRRDDIIISSGMNIYTAEIEQALVQHPAVADCAVYGIPHELLGAVPCAAVQLRPGRSGGPEVTTEILRFLGKQLSSMKLPKKIHYVDEIPRDPSGKLFKRLVREGI